MEPKDYVLRLGELSSKKLSLLNEILLFSRSQCEVIKEQKYEEMDLLIKEKQKRMDAVDKLDEQFAVYSSRLKSQLGISSLEDLPKFGLEGTRTLKENVSGIMELLDQIRAFDQDNSGKIQTELSGLKEKIKTNNSIKKINNAYGAPQNGLPAYYFDKKK
jgi:hypothetical protein